MEDDPGIKRLRIGIEADELADLSLTGDEKNALKTLDLQLGDSFTPEELERLLDEIPGARQAFDKRDAFAQAFEKKIPLDESRIPPS